MEMHEIKAVAKLRRQAMLAEFEEEKARVPVLTITKFAKRHGLTTERMGQILKKARAEIGKGV